MKQLTDYAKLLKLLKKFFKIVRKAQPNLPIIICSAPRYYYADAHEKRLEVIKATYDNAVKAGDKNVVFLSGKEMMKDVKDVAFADPDLSVALLRYFNPIGAHESGLLGEDPNGIPNNLMPYICKVAVGKLPQLNVFGNDYDTPDGTGVRDYIHVVDLAKGHLAALRYLEKQPGVLTVNLGTGKGSSVLDIVNAFEAASGVKIPYVIADRRPGDIATCYASTGKAEELLGWTAEKSLEEMCRDSWNFISKNS